MRGFLLAALFLAASAHAAECPRAFTTVGGLLGSAYRTVRIATGAATSRLPVDVYAIFQRAHQSHKQGKAYELSDAERHVLGKHQALFEEYNRSSALMHLFRTIDQAVALWTHSAPRLRTVTWGDVRTEAGRLAQLFLSLLRYRVHDVYRKVMADPDYVPTPKERRKVEAHWLGRDLERFRELVRTGAVSNPGGPRPHWNAENWRALGELARLGWDVAWGAITTLLPVPTLWLGSLRRDLLLRRLIRDPSHALTPGLFGEQRLVRRYHLEDRIELFRRDLALHGPAYARLNQFRLAGHGVRWAAVLAALALTLRSDHVLSTAESFDEGLEEDEEGNTRSDQPGFKGMSRYHRDKVELIFLHPLPHVALRVGGLIYNYGVGDVTVSRIAEYEKAAGFGSLTSGSHTRVELKVTPEERRRLIEELDKDVAKGSYVLVFPFNDCVAMTNGVLRRALGIDVPKVADRSQALTLSYFNGLRVMGSDLVGNVTFAASAGATTPARLGASLGHVGDVLYFSRHAPTLLLGSWIFDRVLGTDSPLLNGKENP